MPMSFCLVDFQLLLSLVLSFALCWATIFAGTNDFGAGVPLSRG